MTIAALHDLNLAVRFSDRFLLLQHGKVAADGTPETVLAANNTADAYGVRLNVERGAMGQLWTYPTLLHSSDHQRGAAFRGR